ncbi:MAG: M1 family aminopeptidase [Salinibacter sp.]
MSLLRFVRLPSLLIFGLLLSGCSAAPGQDSGGVLPPEQAAYDVTHYDLEVSIIPPRKRIEGTVTVHAVVEKRLKRLVLNLDRRLSVSKAWTMGQPAASHPVERRNDRNEVWIDLAEARAPGDTLHVAVSYEGTPRTAPRAPWEGGFSWSTTPSGDPWIATSCQTEGADLWWPVKDHPSDEPDSMDLSFTVPDSLTAASNGVLRGVERRSDTTRTFHWHVSVPINAYNVTLNAAPYATLDTTYTSTSGASVPVSAYVLPSDSARAARALPDFLQQVRFLEETLGPYPPRADKYGFAQTPFLGMEHQSLIAYGHDFTTGGVGYEASYDALHFHELAHEWYGNLVTVRDWKDFWLHEGPATYLEALYTEHLEGDSAYHAHTDYFRREMSGGTPIAYREPTTAEDIYHRDVYYRGALTLHTLRYVAGEEALRTLLRRFVYPEETSSEGAVPFRNVATDDFIRMAEEVSDRSLDAFFQVYLYQSALPVLKTQRSDGTLQLRWRKTGDTTFEVPVPVRIDGRTKRVAMDDGTGSIEVPEGAAVEVDPKGWILRRQ